MLNDFVNFKTNYTRIFTNCGITTKLKINKKSVTKNIAAAAGRLKMQGQYLGWKMQDMKMLDEETRTGKRMTNGQNDYLI